MHPLPHLSPSPRLLPRQCFREEKNRKRARNLEKARASADAWKQRVARREGEPIGSLGTGAKPGP